MKVVAIIPARYSSARFPGKVVVPIAGKPMIQRVWERTSLAPHVAEVVIATDDERVAKTAAGFGAKVVMTESDHDSGTQRVAEAADKVEADVVINVQGDEPVINPESLELVIQPFIDEDTVSVSSLMHPIASYDDYVNINIVKVVTDQMNGAMYFSRSPLPYYRDCEGLIERWQSEGARPDALKPVPMKHIGVYAYRSEFLQALVRMPRCELETAERLEQLRVLAWSFRITMVCTPHDSIGVDVPADVEKVEAIIREDEG